MIRGLHHVSMRCGTSEEFQRAKEFYCGLLGLPVRREWPEGVMIDLGNAVIEIFNSKPGERVTGAVRHFALACGDVDGDIEKIRAAGYPVFIEPKDVLIPSEPPLPARIAFCSGPLGEEIELFQEKALMEIRQENLDDYEEVYQVVKEAFATAEHSDGNEQDLVAALRDSSSFIPELSLVALENGKIAGHILFTKAYVGKRTVLALAPLSVLPAYQGKGIGQALMKEGHRIAQELGYDYAVVLGHPGYYPKAGYVPASVYGIRAPFDVPDENFMAMKLNKDAEEILGVVQYDKAFGIN